MGKANGRRVRRWWILGGALLVAAGVAVARPKAPEKDDKDKVKTAKAETGSVQVRVTEVGSVEPQVKVDVKSVLSGKVVELPAKEGSGDGAARMHSLRRGVCAEPGVKARVARAQHRRRVMVLHGRFDFRVAADVEETEWWAGQLDQPE